AILGFGRNLARAEELTPEHRKEVEIIRRSGDHLLEMIDEILSLARIEAGRTELYAAPFDLVKSLKDIGQMIALRIQDKGLRFDFELDPALPRAVRGDAVKLRQIVINLLGNAVKFTHKGYVRLCASSKISVDDPKRVLLQLAVEDSGVGIPEDQLGSIFDSFVQDDHSGDTNSGTGLGLTICRSLVDMMGGRIEVTSKVGEGSVFTVIIPLALVNESAIETRQTHVISLKSRQTALRILVADDSSDNRTLLTSILERVGFIVCEVANGEAAVKAFQEWNPHLICMDMRMPVLDGYAATRKIRELPQGNVVKIIAVTASVFDEQRGEILDAGCDDLVFKPVRESVLFEAIRQQLGVSYRYSQKQRSNSREGDVILTREMLRDLPEELLAELHEAALIQDRQTLVEIIGQIKAQAPETAEGLKVLLDGFQLGRIRELLGDRI
ncbi:MAG: ATP-binding protein, partial [Desulfobulbia bacterium]